MLLSKYLLIHDVIFFFAGMANSYSRHYRFYAITLLYGYMVLCQKTLIIDRVIFCVYVCMTVII